MQNILNRVITIQAFIHLLEERHVPKALLIRVKKGYTNKRILDVYRALMFNVEISHVDNRTIFVVPYCNLTLRIGLGHGLSIYDVVYPDEGYFSNPKNTLDEAYATERRQI